MELDIALLVALVIALAWLAWRITRLGHDVSRLAHGPSESLELLQREVEAVRSGVDARLREHGNYAQDLIQRLTSLQKATEDVGQLGTELAELQKIFRPSHTRGAFGERMLEDLLADVLPRDRFRVQYTYPVSGVRADVAVFLGDGRLLAIDSKFPLDNFRRYVEARGSDGGDAATARRAFARDVRRHIDDIAGKYLSPEDGTLDIAFMYLPSESIFQEVTYAAPNGVDSLVEYALRKRVVPVSPNTLYAYLCVIRMGLRGFDLQQNAREVLQHLTHLGAGVEELRSELGTAIRQARHSLNNLTDADRALRKVEERLELVSGLRKGEGLTTARTNESDESGEAGAV